MHLHQDIIEDYTLHLAAQQQQSSLSERLQFSVWMYMHHPKMVAEIEAIWKLMKGRS